jgi:hypothetical protein
LTLYRRVPRPRFIILFYAGWIILSKRAGLEPGAVPALGGRPPLTGRPPLQEIVLYVKSCELFKIYRLISSPEPLP